MVASSLVLGWALDLTHRRFGRPQCPGKERHRRWSDENWARKDNFRHYRTPLLLGRKGKPEDPSGFCPLWGIFPPTENLWTHIGDQLAAKVGTRGGNAELQEAEDEQHARSSSARDLELEWTRRLLVLPWESGVWHKVRLCNGRWLWLWGSPLTLSRVMEKMSHQVLMRGKHYWYSLGKNGHCLGQHLDNLFQAEGARPQNVVWGQTVREWNCFV